jgi:serine/threonine protein phosphatase PrpC
VHYAIRTDVGEWKHERDGVNEDSVTAATFEDYHRDERSGAGLFVLSDGVGSTDVPERASNLATTTIAAELSGPVGRSLASPTSEDAIDAVDPATASSAREGANGTPATSETGADNSPRRSPLVTAFEGAFGTADEAVRDLLDEPGVDSAAATALGVVVRDDAAHLGWAGDSHLYLINRSRETIRQVTTGPAEGKDSSLDSPVAARINPRGSLSPTAVVGGKKFADTGVNVGTASVDLYADDVLLLTSDGLLDAYIPTERDEPLTHLRRVAERFDEGHPASERGAVLDRIVTEDEIRDVVLSAPGLDEAADTLIDLANDRGGKDNISVCLVGAPTERPTPSGAETRGTVPAPLTPAGQLAVGSEGATADQAATADSETASTSTIDGEASDGAEVETDGEATDVVPVTASLSVVGGDDRVRHVVADGDAIGRGSDPDVAVRVRRETVSAIHCVFHRNDDGWSLLDRSKNGTVVRHPPERGEWSEAVDSDRSGSNPVKIEGELVELQDGTRITPVHVRESEGNHRDEFPTFRFHLDG